MTITYLVICLSQPGDSVTPHCWVSVMGGQQLQGVLYIHWLPFPQKFQCLFGLLREIPINTFQEFCQSLKSKKMFKLETAAYYLG